MKFDSMEQLADVVDDISESIKRLKGSGISDDALVTLIVRCCRSVPSEKNRRDSRPVRRVDVIEIMNGMENLSEYVFPSAEGDKQ